jgi:hypothetical protein
LPGVRRNIGIVNGPLLLSDRHAGRLGTRMATSAHETPKACDVSLRRSFQIIPSHA